MTVFIGMLFASCSVQENARLVFFNYRGQGISQDLEPIQPGEAVKKEISFGRTGFYKPFFDSKTNEIYLVFNFRKEGVLFNSDGLIYKLDNNGNIMQFYTYRFKRNDEIFGSYIYGINDSIVLAGFSNNQYELFHIDDGFIEFLAKAYDIFDRMGSVYRYEIYEVIHKCYEDDYHLKDDIDLVSITEHIESLFSRENF